jgi:hypothetical protein
MERDSSRRSQQMKAGMTVSSNETVYTPATGVSAIEWQLIEVTMLVLNGVKYDARTAGMGVP